MRPPLIIKHQTIWESYFVKVIRHIFNTTTCLGANQNNSANKWTKYMCDKQTNLRLVWHSWTFSLTFHWWLFMFCRLFKLQKVRNKWWPRTLVCMSVQIEIGAEQWFASLQPRILLGGKLIACTALSDYVLSKLYLASSCLLSCKTLITCFWANCGSVHCMSSSNTSRETDSRKQRNGEWRQLKADLDFC